MPGDARPESSIILYQTEDGRTRVQCRFENETIWLSQALIGELFQITVPTLNEHLKGIYDDAELEPGTTIRKFRIVRMEGMREVTREIEHYNLDAILAVGYRVRSRRGTQFRQWATARLSEYLVKGFSMDDERLKNPPAADVPDYFDELTSWKSGKVRKGDVTVAKNYLSADEITELNRIVIMFLDFAEDQARRRKQIFLRDWQTRLDEFLRFNDRNVLPNAGSVSREAADTKAEQEYERFAARRREHVEAAASAEAIKELEDIARQLPTPAPSATTDPA